jgi:hypothetical protein
LADLIGRAQARVSRIMKRFEIDLARHLTLTRFSDLDFLEIDLTGARRTPLLCGRGRVLEKYLASPE